MAPRSTSSKGAFQISLLLFALSSSTHLSANGNQEKEHDRRYNVSNQLHPSTRPANESDALPEIVFLTSENISNCFHGNSDLHFGANIHDLWVQYHHNGEWDGSSSPATNRLECRMSVRAADQKAVSLIIVEQSCVSGNSVNVSGRFA